MHKTIENINIIKNSIKSKLLDLNQQNKSPKIIAVSKTFKMDHIMPLIEYGHEDFGENKVQEAVEKWKEVKIKKNQIKLHMVGKLQTNKVKLAVELFDYIHSVDNLKLAEKISLEQKKINKLIKIFIQINIGNESKKSGININDVQEFSLSCSKLGLDVIGTMCLPPINENSDSHFLKMMEINNTLGFKEMSMGMSSDFLKAIEYNSTFLRIGTDIFGKRI
tara:strand:- start:1108 stop:1770 length:663 start_codon:yes stop_codon:yes gene_type:complete